MNQRNKTSQEQKEKKEKKKWNNNNQKKNDFQNVCHTCSLKYIHTCIKGIKINTKISKLSNKSPEFVAKKMNEKLVISAWYKNWLEGVHENKWKKKNWKKIQVVPILLSKQWSWLSLMFFFILMISFHMVADDKAIDVVSINSSIHYCN